MYKPEDVALGSLRLGFLVWSTISQWLYLKYAVILVQHVRNTLGAEGSIESRFHLIVENCRHIETIVLL